MVDNNNLKLDFITIRIQYVITLFAGTIVLCIITLVKFDGSDLKIREYL